MKGSEIRCKKIFLLFWFKCTLNTPKDAKFHATSFRLTRLLGNA